APPRSSPRCARVLVPVEPGPSVPFPALATLTPPRRSHRVGLARLARLLRRTCNATPPRRSHRVPGATGESSPAEGVAREEEILALDRALPRLAEEDPAAAQVVRLHFFAGLSIERTAEVLGVSRATA